MGQVTDTHALRLALYTRPNVTAFLDKLVDEAKAEAEERRDRLQE
jgi:hypothetical protein